MITKNINLDVNNIVEQLSNIDFQAAYDALGGKGNRNENLENAKLPPFAYAYYHTFCKKGQVPLPLEVVNTYIRYFCVNRGQGMYSIRPDFAENEIVFSRQELSGRICRAYNSFNRELVLLAQLSSLATQYEVKYDFHTDYYNGIDIIAQNENAIAGIAVFQKSPNAYKYRQLKEKYRHDYGDIKLFSAVSSPDTTNRCGDIDIFSYKHVYEIHNKIVDFFRRQTPQEKTEIHMLTEQNIYIKGKTMPVPF